MATCDIGTENKINELIDYWFKKDGVINNHLGKDSSKYFRQVWASVTKEDFDYGATPSMKKLNHLENRIKRIEKGFQKRTGKFAEFMYLPEEVLKNNYEALKTFRFFMKSHRFFQGQRDEYQSVLNSIVKKLGEKSRVLSLNNKGGFKNITSAHKELQKRYNKYQEIMSNQGWRAAEKYWNENLKNLAQESQFEVFTLADEALRNPALIKNDPAKYGMFADVVNEWKSISPRLYKDLLNGLKFHINAVKEVNQITDGKYNGIISSLEKVQTRLLQENKKGENRNYFPTEVLQMFPTMRVIQDSIYDRASAKGSDFKDLSKYVENMSDTLIKELNLTKHSHEAKSKGRVRRNKDVITVMDNYIRNITMFNFSGTSTDALVKGIKNIMRLQGGEQEEQATFYVDYLHDTHATMMGLNIRTPFWRSAVRAVTAFEFISKLGLNIRGAARNATQSLQNYVYFGMKGMRDAFQYLETANIGAAAVKEAKKHGVYFAEARELTNSLGLFPEVVTSNINGKDVFTYKYDTAGSKFTSGLESLASKASKPMRWIENNVNRQLTFKLAFALHHQYLSNNRGMMEREIREVLGKVDTQAEKDKIIIEQKVNEAITRKSSNFAAAAVKELHYEYSAFGKPKILRTAGGSIFGQFATYSVNFWNYQYKIAQQAKDSMLAGDWSSQEAFRLYRLGSLYSVINGMLSPLTNTDIGNLIQHDTYGRIKNIVDAMSSDPETRKKAFFGKGPIIGTVGGPFVSDLVSLGNVFGFYDILGNGKMSEHSILGYLAGYQDYADKRQSDKLYDLARILNTQIARTAFVTAPRMYNGAGLGTLAALELGLNPNKEMKQRKARIIRNIEKTTGFNLDNPSYDKSEINKRIPTKNLSIQDALNNMQSMSSGNRYSDAEKRKYIKSLNQLM